MPSVLIPSCPSRCDDLGDGGCVAFGFRREYDGVAGDEDDGGVLEQREGTE